MGGIIVIGGIDSGIKFRFINLKTMSLDVSLDLVVWNGESSLSFEEVFCSVEIYFYFVVLFIIFDFGWLAGGEVESGFLLIVELDDSSSREESSSFSEADSDVDLSLELSFSL